MTSEARPENVRQALLCDVGHLGALSCHVRKLTALRVPCYAEAKAAWKGMC